jgi:nucleoside-diphosphate-sugar epimerase
MADRGLVLVTGGTGYIAGFCIAQLLNEGWRVRATLRNPAREAEARAAIGRAAGGLDKLSFVVADLDKDAGWAEAARGVDYVLHVASPLPAVNPKDDDELVRPARDGALRVLRAARDAGVRRVVMTASAAAVAYGRGSRETPFTEKDWSDETNRADTSAYERSKTIAERAAWDWHGREGGALEFVTICPGAVLGPLLGRDFSPSIEIVRKLLDGSVPGLPRFGWPIVDVRDLADLHVRAMTAAAAPGQRYLAAGPFLWMTDIARALREGAPWTAKRIPRLALPDWIVRIAATFDPIVRGRLFELGKKRPISADKARAELGWTMRPTAETLLATAESLKAEGLAK